jgi:thiol-disulfide isomerase/thioredoxin
MDFISSSVMLLGNDGKDAQLATFQKFKDYLTAKKKLQINDVQMAMLACQNLEQLSDVKFAKQAYQTFADILASRKDETFAPIIELMRASVQRLDLPGKVMDIRGTTITGEEFSIESLRGKYVLVNVWATFSPPCVQEYPYIRKIYDTYQDSGFEVVGICLDTDRDVMLKFIRDNQMPWVNLYDADQPGTHPVTTKYGIASFPTMILLDREGKVLSLETRGLILGNALAKLLGK